MERTSPSTPSVIMTTGGTTISDSASIGTKTLDKISSTPSHLTSLSGTLNSPILSDHSTKTMTHVEYLTKLIQRVDERDTNSPAIESNCKLSDTTEAKSDISCLHGPLAIQKDRKQSEILDSSTIPFNKLKIYDTNNCVTDTSSKDDCGKEQKVDVLLQLQLKKKSQPIYEPISKKLNNLQRIKGIEYALSNKQNTNPNNDHSLTTKCDNNVTCVTSLPPHIKILPKTQSLDRTDDKDDANASCIVVSNPLSNVNIVVHNNSSLVATNDGILKGTIPRLQAGDQSRPIYPSLNFSPYASPFNSPRTGRKRAPLRESRRVSIEQNGSFLFLNQYKLMDEIGQVNISQNSTVQKN